MSSLEWSVSYCMDVCRRWSGLLSTVWMSVVTGVVYTRFVCCRWSGLL